MSHRHSACPRANGRARSSISRLPDKTTGREEGEGGEEEGKRREDPFAAGDRFLSGVSWTSRGGRLCAVKDCGPPLLLQRNIILFALRTHQKET